MNEVIAWIILCGSFGAPVALAAFFLMRRLPDVPDVTLERRQVLLDAKRSMMSAALIAIAVLYAGVIWSSAGNPFTWGQATVLLVGAALLGAVTRLVFGGGWLNDR